ncbi:Na+/H+ antiporter NhaC family protein [Neiella marina]|uniref:Na+/H+ antiporter NhaC family protein n=1 Tax=Neiella holothuriorum TaxID=2870530 RepID=A0ABS7EEB7_9GAMM|nr:Na+/H+ antiporter NhaC family protein [Neiella holothuriorum]MBW8190683.1 Na+/H+ antiporter NhaC family protein [Neiella holothuriorum]
MNFAESAWSLLPPLLALTAAVVTRRVVPSLAIGILAGVILLGGGDWQASAQILWQKVSGLVWADGGLNSWNLYIVAFLLLLGMLTSLLSLSGATQAFADWAIARIQTARGARLTTVFLGVVIFIDDYFNSLAVGSVSRPITDKLRTSRAKLAYLLDSTAAPMCVLMPVSSWGAYIIAVIGGILVSHQITDISPLHAFVAMIPMNFYAVFAIGLVIVTAIWPINLGAMKDSERRALEGDTGRVDASALADEQEPLANGHLLGLLVPIATLVFATVIGLVVTGAMAVLNAGDKLTALAALENTDVGLSLVIGGVIALAVAVMMLLRQRPTVKQLGRSFTLGAASMKGAIIVLFFAWCIGSVISDLKTGTYLASFVGDSMGTNWLPVLLFVLAGLMAFSTGTSWGTFGIMLPIAGDMAAATDLVMMLPYLAAVLAGSVFGDHCSPISDTTILSSTGAGCDHIEHVRTQLPYAVLVAIVSAVGYAVLGTSGSVMAGFFAASAVFTLVVWGLQRGVRDV